MAFGSFFSAALTAQNSPELHFRFLNSFIQSSPLRSLPLVDRKSWKIAERHSISLPETLKCYLQVDTQTEQQLKHECKKDGNDDDDKFMG